LLQPQLLAPYPATTTIVECITTNKFEAQTNRFGHFKRSIEIAKIIETFKQVCSTIETIKIKKTKTSEKASNHTILSIITTQNDFLLMLSKTSDCKCSSLAKSEPNCVDKWLCTFEVSSFSSARSLDWGLDFLASEELGD
jgi:hypothetical protein